jgi:DNA polymerase III epsilon subunit-like protein
MLGEHLLRFNQDKKIVFIDAETASLCLHESHNLPWEIAMLRVQGNKVVDEFCQLLKWTPPLKVSRDAAKITGYSEDRVNREGKDPRTVADTVNTWLHEADYIVGHNILCFDYYIVNALFRHLGIPVYNFTDKVLDTSLLLKGIKMSAPYDGKSSLLEYQYKLYHHIQKGLKTNLTLACKEHGIEVDPTKTHHALYDLSINYQLFRKLIFQIEV